MRHSPVPSQIVRGHIPVIKCEEHPDLERVSPVIPESLRRYNLCIDSVRATSESVWVANEPVSRLPGSLLAFERAVSRDSEQLC